MHPSIFRAVSSIWFISASCEKVCLCSDAQYVFECLVSVEMYTFLCSEKEIERLIWLKIISCLRVWVIRLQGLVKLQCLILLEGLAVYTVLGLAQLQRLGRWPPPLSHTYIYIDLVCPQTRLSCCWFSLFRFWDWRKRTVVPSFLSVYSKCLSFCEK